MKHEEKKDWLSNHFEGFYLQKMKFLTDLEAGQDVKGIEKYFSADSLTELQQRKTLKIEDFTKKKFEHGDKVEIFLKIKNVQQLQVKLFEVNTQAYYRKHQTFVREDIDLDGLIPMHTETLDLSAVSPLRTVQRGFHFPEVEQKHRGIFIAEFIGSGLLTRALIRKGGLTLIRQPTAKGIIFNVVNEKKEVCAGEGTGILVGGQFYRAEGASGDILLPYSTKMLRENAVVVFGDFADLVPVEVPPEMYAFLTLLIFNEESLVPGATTKIVLHPKLIFNGRAISVELVKNPKVIITATNEADVASSTTFSNLKFSYDEDTAIDYLVPAKLKKLEVRAEGVVTLMNGTELNVNTTEFITVQKKAGKDLFCDLFLQKAQDGYLLRLLGKNGEPLVHKALKATFYSSFFGTGYGVSEEFKTDERGCVVLGSLPQVLRIQVSYVGSGLETHTWTVNEPQTEAHVQKSYHICLGEDLVLPALGLPIEKSHFKFTQITSSSKSPMADCYTKISKSGNSLVLKFDKPGLYLFKYLTIDQSVEILVIEGKRWQYSQNFIAEKHQLTKMISDLSYMTLESREFRDGQLRLKINCNNPSKLKLHVLGFTFYPDNAPEAHTVARKMCPHYARDTFGFPRTENSYLSEKKLSDETKYVLDRRTRPAFLGNTLEKPPVLLKRHFVRDTRMREETLDQGQDFKNKDIAENKGAFAKTDQAKLSMPGPRTWSANRLSEFLAVEGLLLANVKPTSPDLKSFVIPIPNYQHYTTLRVYASDVMSNISFDVPLTTAAKLPTADVRLQHSKQAGNIYCATRLCQSASEGEKLTIEDIQNCELSLIDSLDRAFYLMGVLSLYGDRSLKKQLDKWVFLSNWHRLTPDQQQQYYDEFCGHELNVFLFLKDRSFFDRVVRRFISSKSKLDLLDHILLGNDAQYTHKFSFINFSKLKPIELAIAVLQQRSKNPDLCRKLINAVESQVRSNPFEAAEYKKFFDTVINNQMVDLPEARLDTDALENTNKPNQQALNFTGKMVVPKPPPKLMPQSLKRKLDRHPFAEEVHFDQEDAHSLMMLDEDAPRLRMNKSVSSEKEEYDHMSGSEHNYSEDEELQASVQSIRNIRKKLNEDARRISRSRSRSAEDSCSDQLSMVNSQVLVVKDNRAIREEGGIIEHTPDLEKKVLVQAKKTETTKEYIERNYFFDKDAQSSQLNTFWLNLIKGWFEKGEAYLCLDHNFILCCKSMSEIIQVIGILSLPSTKAELNTRKEGSKLVIECTKGRFIQFCKQMNEKSAGKVELDVILSQRFYDPLDKYVFDEVNPNLSTLKQIDEFLVGKLYASRVAVTNSSESAVELEVVCEVPQGAIPVNCLDYTKTYTMTLQPLATSVKEFSFYFPHEGEFSVFPATAVKQTLFAGHARLSQPTLKVVKKKTARGALESISEILTSGSKADIISFLETKNLLNKKIFDFKDIYWLLKEEKFFLQVIDVLRRRMIFDSTAWAFSILHGCKREYFEYLTATKNNLSQSYLSVAGLEIDDFEIKEYNPLTNPRTHNVGNRKHNLNNQEFRETYLCFLEYCFQKPKLNNRDRLVLASYLLLQDRVEEAQTQMAGIVRDRSLANEELKIQLDYLTAYLSLYNEIPHFTTARALSQQYLEYPIPTWRTRFVQIANQLTEFSGQGEQIEIEGAAQNPESRLAKSEQLRIEIRDQTKLNIKSRNVEKVTVSYYEIELEILFSKDPFFNRDMTDSFNDVFPSQKQTVEVGSGLEEAEKLVDIPENLRNKNLLIYVQTSLLSEKVRYFPAEINVVFASEIGYVKVYDKERKPLSKVYVKAFSQARSGAVEFYKDGYTDLRGVFDYSSLNADKLEQVERLSLLVTTPKLGSVTRIVGKPTKLGQYVDGPAGAIVSSKEVY